MFYYTLRFFHIFQFKFGFSHVFPFTIVDHAVSIKVRRNRKLKLFRFVIYNRQVGKMNLKNCNFCSSNEFYDDSFHSCRYCFAIAIQYSQLNSQTIKLKQTKKRFEKGGQILWPKIKNFYNPLQVFKVDFYGNLSKLID